MPKKPALLIFLLLLLAAAWPLPPAPAAGSPPLLSTLRAGHPRLIATREDEARVKQLIQTDGAARRIYENTRRQAESLLSEPVTDFAAVDYRDNIVKTRVMLGKVRQCLGRVYTLLTIYRLDGGREFMDRAKAELLAAAALPDWNRIHFLDTAEMMHAFAIGYDWMYQDLSESERRVLREALVEKGLVQAKSAYRGRGYFPWGHWVKARHNWNQVCNGGIALGALAIADEEPELCERILASAISSVKLPMAEFAPDGAWAEGPSYWSYATRYNVYLLAGLQTALGTDLGLGQMEGFNRTGLFRIHSEGPLGLSFNYADASPKAHADEQMFWLAREFNEPLYAWHARRYLDDLDALGLWWYDPRGQDAARPPLDAYFRRAEVAFFRSAWDDPGAIFIGFKGGDNTTNHSHLDLGSFVFDAMGVRWAEDLGGDSYKLPFYFDTYLGSRWRYYRLRTEGHNTILLNGKNQGTRARAPVIAFQSTPELAFAVADLTEGYGALARSVRRGIALVGRRMVVIQDEIETALPAEVVWGFHTGAEIELGGRTALLSQGESGLVLRIVEPANAFFQIVSAAPAPPQNPNEGIKNLTIQLPGKVTSVRIVAELIPFRREPIGQPQRKVVPLGQW